MPASRPTLRERINYRFDSLMSKGTLALIGGLFVISLTIIIIAAAIVSLGGMLTAPQDSSGPMPFGEAVWESLMRTLDAGTMGGDTGWVFRGIMLFVTLGGIFVVSTLIGVLSNGIESQMERLRKGRSLVLEHDHTVILGWSPQIFTIISELVLANENRKSGAVVVDPRRPGQGRDGGRDQGARRRHEEHQGHLPLGQPHRPDRPRHRQPAFARAVDHPASQPDGTKDPDSHVIKSVLAITNNPNRRAEPYHVVTQIRDAKNLDVVKMVGQKDHVQPVLTNDLIARVVAQTSRQSGLVGGLHRADGLRRRRDLLHAAAASLAGKTLCRCAVRLRRLAR